MGERYGGEGPVWEGPVWAEERERSWQGEGSFLLSPSRPNPPHPGVG